MLVDCLAAERSVKCLEARRVGVKHSTTSGSLVSIPGLRRGRLHLDRHELIVDTAINDPGGIVVEKQTKTRSSRAVSLVDATVELLREHLAEMDARAAFAAPPLRRTASCSALTRPAALPYALSCSLDECANFARTTA